MRGFSTDRICKIDGRVRNLLMAFRRLVSQIPTFSDAGVIVGPVSEWRSVTQITEEIIVERRREAAGNCTSLRVIIGPIADIVGFAPKEARIESADDLMAVAKQFAPEPARINPKVRAHDVVDTKTRQL